MNKVFNDAMELMQANDNLIGLQEMDNPKQSVILKSNRAIARKIRDDCGILLEDIKQYLKVGNE